MIYDTNLLINHIRTRNLPPIQTIIPIVVIGELEAFSLKADWGAQKIDFMRYMIDRYPISDIELDIIPVYAQIDAFSQGKLQTLHSNLPPATWAKTISGLLLPRSIWIWNYTQPIMTSITSQLWDCV
ncbi:PIN domain-containing protein [Spirosoma endbachense]|uniref:Uncharacterized protein n=1 Tax=Spirosoma endbachense TaxID=2666025 RepID=A0A6P1VTW4_9BACT|nr:PIN domain-containing protein [Spirosoma endbachense]QHV95430.1 hypothetical protein GJR95_10610 [Spirosoma endbachense]